MLADDTLAAIPRRNRVDLMTPAELAVLAAMGAVEKAGADPRLTSATVLLDQARHAIADFVDGEETRDEGRDLMRQVARELGCPEDSSATAVFRASLDLAKRMRDTARLDEPDLDGWEWAIVEIFGHRRHAGRIREEERFGAKMMRVDAPNKGDPVAHGWTTHFYAGGSIFSITPAEQEACLKANRPYERAARLTYQPDDADERPF